MRDTPAREPGLAASLRALAVHESEEGTSTAVHLRLLDEVRRLRLLRRRSLVKTSVLLTVLCVGTVAPIWHLATHDIDAPPSTSQRLPALPTKEMVTAFFPLTYSDVPMSGGRLVRLQVPRQIAVEFGVDASEPARGSSASTVLADVLVGDDGLARAVRFVRPVINDLKGTQQ